MLGAPPASPGGRTRCPRSSRARRSPPASPSRRRSTPRSPRVPGLVAGAADLTGNTGTKLAGQIADVRRAPRAAARSTTASASTAWARRMVGMALHGGVLPAGGTFFVFLDYMRPPVRLAALSGAKVVLRLHPRLRRRRRGRPHPPAGRARRHAAGHPRPAGHPPGRRQRDRRRVAAPPSSTTGPPRSVLSRQNITVVHRRLGRRTSAPASCVDADDAAGRAARHRQRGEPVRRGRRRAGRRRRARPRGQHAVAGTASTPSPPRTGPTVLPAGVPGAVGRGRRHLRLGTVAPTTASASTASAPARRATS